MNEDKYDEYSWWIYDIISVDIFVYYIKQRAWGRAGQHYVHSGGGNSNTHNLISILNSDKTWRKVKAM